VVNGLMRLLEEHIVRGDDSGNIPARCYPEPGLRSCARADVESETDRRLRDDGSNVDLACT
jgi:hypothetical protein